MKVNIKCLCLLTTYGNLFGSYPLGVQTLLVSDWNRGLPGPLLAGYSILRVRKWFSAREINNFACKGKHRQGGTFMAVKSLQFFICKWQLRWLDVVLLALEGSTCFSELWWVVYHVAESLQTWTAAWAGAACPGAWAGETSPEAVVAPWEAVVGPLGKSCASSVL